MNLRIQELDMILDKLKIPMPKKLHLVGLTIEDPKDYKVLKKSGEDRLTLVYAEKFEDLVIPEDARYFVVFTPVSMMSRSFNKFLNFYRTEKLLMNAAFTTSEYDASKQYKILTKTTYFVFERR
jgi:hypothetical protein